MVSWLEIVLVTGNGLHDGKLVSRLEMVFMARIGSRDWKLLSRQLCRYQTSTLDDYPILISSATEERLCFLADTLYQAYHCMTLDCFVFFSLLLTPYFRNLPKHWLWTMTPSRYLHRTYLSCLVRDDKSLSILGEAPCVLTEALAGKGRYRRSSGRACGSC